jgi:hypothetical protein
MLSGNKSKSVKKFWKLQVLLFEEWFLATSGREVEEMVFVKERERVSCSQKRELFAKERE